ncbi:RNA-directed DNA polymerase, eukaryota, reverse transcriptase zinc-binding domain protein [Tanacetum coccineum]|uniref:RNA-directed DNA polymerase, eukaryota, reverse transcriptase zinc-binding domain protein n=1 Tax=Tanacetum coccineum TaxID=301880 RepID=A0ABQ5D4Q3_9ASTR
MPPALTSKGLWTVCAPYGRLVDAFIANKLSKGDSILLVKLKDIDSMSNMYTICRNEGFSDLNIHHVGGYWIWIQFLSSSACSKFQENESLKKLYSVKEHPHPTLHFGKFLFFEKEDSSALSSGRVCISSKSHGLISENVQVEINNELFEATVQEISSWFDDLEYIQTNLNNIVNQVSKQKIDNNEENKQDEEDIHLIVPQQPPKEEANNKDSNPECKAESSDLSRPPGFEFMKESSSPSSKCSTSFARFRKKDIKVWLEKTVVVDCSGELCMVLQHVSKLALWNRLQDFMHHHNGSYIMFGDMNAVSNEQERVGSIFNNIEADYFNSFIDATGLADLPIGGGSFTWME